jgi:hypothetical protein
MRDARQSEMAICAASRLVALRRFMAGQAP